MPVPLSAPADLSCGWATSVDGPRNIVGGFAGRGAEQHGGECSHPNTSPDGVNQKLLELRVREGALTLADRPTFAATAQRSRTAANDVLSDDTERWGGYDSSGAGNCAGGGATLAVGVWQLRQNTSSWTRAAPTSAAALLAVRVQIPLLTKPSKLAHSTKFSTANGHDGPRLTPGFSCRLRPSPTPLTLRLGEILKRKKRRILHAVMRSATTPHDRPVTPDQRNCPDRTVSHQLVVGRQSCRSIPSYSVKFRAFSVLVEGSYVRSIT